MSLKILSVSEKKKQFCKECFIDIAIQSEVPANKEEDSTTSSSNSSGNTTSNSTKSSRSAAPVSSVFLDRFRKTYKNMSDEKKWILKTGKVVENEIFRLAFQIQFEK